MISNLRQSSDEDVQDFFERVSTCVMLSFKESIIDMKKEFVGGHVACIEKATKFMCEQIIMRLFISGFRTKIRQQVESNLSTCKDNQELLQCSLMAEVSLSNPARRSLSEIAEINTLRQELAAMRLATLVPCRIAALLGTGLRTGLKLVPVLEVTFLPNVHVHQPHLPSVSQTLSLIHI